MKTGKIFLLLITLAIHTNTFSQKRVDTLYNFKVENKKVIWQKIYNDSTSQKNYVKQIISKYNTENLQEIDNTISFNLKNEEVDFKKYGGKWSNTPIFLQEPINYFVVIEFKEKRYRITVKNIVTVSGDYDNTDISYYTEKKNQLKNSKTSRKALNYYNQHFLEKFKPTTKEDW